MRSLRLALIGLGLAGLAAGVGALAVVLSSDHLQSVQTEGAVFTPLIGWAFIGTGLFAWWRRPENRLGALMTAVGFVWFCAALIASDNPTLFAIGGMVNALPYALFLHLLVAFPTGRLRTRWERFLVGLGYFDTTVVVLLSNLFLDTTDPDICTGCPSNPLMISDQITVAWIILSVQALIGVFGLTAVAILLIRRWRSASTATRRAFTPVLASGTLAAFFLGLSLISDIVGFPTDAQEDVIDVLGAASIAAVPFGFLFGLLRSRLSRADAVSEFVAGLGEVDPRQGLRDAIAQALGDPSLSLAYWVPDQERYVDADGHPVELPSPGGDMSCIEVEHEGRPVATICHDAGLDAEPELIQTVAAAASLALENERLNVELRARVEELRASRARIVEAADEERRRLERDLHDGAQQRLVSLALNLRLASSKLDTDVGCRQGPARGDRHGARRRDRRAARAGARPPPRRAQRPRPAAGARGARGPGAVAGGAGGSVAGAPAPRGRVGLLLRGRRGAHQRRPVRAGVPRRGQRQPRQRPGGGRDPR